MFNYYKPGKGVRKDEPEKNIFALYFSVFWRKFRKFIGINLLYLVCVLPPVLIVAYLCSPLLAGLGLKWSNFGRYICFVMMYLVFIGIAPINIGAAAVFKKYARQQHAWVVPEFFSAIKENFPVCFRLFLIDIVFSAIFLADMYFLPSFQGWSYVITSLTTYFLTFLFIAAHFYVYQVILMFDVGAVGALKSSIILAAAKLPQSLLLFLIILIAGTIINNPITFLFFGFAPLSFASNLYAERFLTKKYIENAENE